MVEEKNYLEIWNSFRQGDERSFKELYDFYFHPLLNYGLRFTKDVDVAEDAVQELFIKLWSNRQHINETNSVKNYLYKAYRRIIIAKIQSLAKRREDNLIEDLIEFNFQISHEQVSIEREDLIATQQKIQHALSAMKGRHREILYLRFYEELSYEQIAELMDLSTKSAYKLVYRALDKLRSKLDGIPLVVLFTVLKMSQLH